MDVVSLLTTLLKEESLRESEGLLSVAIDHQAAGDEHEDAIVLGGLVVGYSVR